MVGEVCLHWSPRGDRRRLKEESVPLFVLFVLFGQAKRTLKEKYHKVTFSFIVLLYDQKSFKRAFLPLKKHPPRARVSRTSHAWQVRAAQGKVKVGGFTAPRGFSYTTRANISHEKAEQIRARIVCTPA